MRSSVILCLVLLSFNLFARPDRKLSDGRLAYYGEEFYRTKITKELLRAIMEKNHIVVPGKPDVISESCQGECYRHDELGYDGARRVMFGELFITKDSKGTFVKDVYCAKKFYFKSVGEIFNRHTEINTEHTWPQSKFSRRYSKTMQKSDLHHLYPTDSLANNRRANHDFGDIRNHHDELNVQNCEISQLGQVDGEMLFTPPETHRGNVARSLFYFAARYDMNIDKADEMLLRKWHKEDPVSEEERARHEIIAKYQNVRNPFIDFPELVEKVADF